MAETIKMQAETITQIRTVQQEQEYYNDTSRLTSTLLREFMRDPRRYIWAVTEGFVETDALRFGRAFHLYVLQPEIFKEYVVVMPEFGRSATDQRAKTEWLQENEDKLVLRASEMEMIKEMGDALMQYKEVVELLSMGTGGDVERVFYFDIEDVPCKCKIDKIVSQSLILDIKTVSDFHPDKFQWHIRDYGYDIQAAFYRLGTGISDVSLLCIEKKPPYLVYRVDFGKRVLAEAERRVLEAVREFKEFKKQWSRGEFNPYKVFVFTYDV